MTHATQQPEQEVKPRRKHRVFLWSFLAIQALFLLGVILGASTANGGDTSCIGLPPEDLKACEDAGDLGTTIGVGIIVAFWAATDIILGVTYGLYRLVKR